MLGFFRINDPYRLLILFLAVLFLRLPYLIGSEPLIYETDWMLIGENIGFGKVLYKDFVTPIAPLSAWTYMVIAFIFGKSILALQILSILLITYQFSLFNNIMLRNKAYDENSYIPAFIYALMAHTFYDFFTLSPVLISLTFILLVLDNIYLRIENKLDDATILKTGVFMGLAILFYLPALIFLVATILSFAMLTSLVLRRYLLFLYGILFPIGIVMIYFFWQGALEDMLFQWLRFNIFNSTNPVVDLTSILMIALLPSLIFIYAIYKTFVQGRFTNYQVRVQQVMFIMFLAALGTWWFSDDQAPYELLIFLPSFAFFINHLLFQFKSKKNAEVFILSFSILLIGISYSIYYQNSPIHKYGDYNKLTNQESVLEEFVAGKSVMILGGSPDLYSSAEKISTRFYHPTLSTEIFNDMNNKEQLMALYDDIIKNQPEVIIDFLGYFSKTKTKMPSINKDYVQKTQSIYTLTLIKKSDSF